MTDKENPEERRERMRQEELKKNPTGNVKDAFHRTNNGSLVDLVNGLGWKGARILVLILLLIVIICLVFFR
ncbi:DUF6366 family protein [Virgibacillus sp. 179-BFC.A HS]|uniref:DUF6366 family protein n=1 Tax=Tigheibacillus jepli TaxID=3035914 RepID=A0ABU5CIS9_9BACI|nr:DUF6366 family protein [Virgibacillus sp. 179-BFC.A HS]MDY0406130.1 DUF6366 family protein [Virgibacillus sp. 179-BFC.A HS]